MNVLQFAIHFQFPSCCTAWELCSAKDVFQQGETWETGPKIWEDRGHWFKSYVFLMLPLALLPLSVPSLPTLMSLFSTPLVFDKSLSGCHLVHQDSWKKTNIITCCANAKSFFLNHAIFVLFFISSSVYVYFRRIEIWKPVVWSNGTCVIVKCYSPHHCVFMKQL